MAQTPSHKDDLERIGGLSMPSKMPCYSYSLPAKDCILGSLLAKQDGTVCSECYARKGRYVMPNVQRAMENRLWQLGEALYHPKWEPEYTQAFKRVLYHKLKHYRGGKRDPSYFRWHDSGDLQGVDHLRIIARIANGTPRVKHWLPTREVGMVREYLKRGTFPSNLTVRVSLPRVGDTVPNWYMELHQCPQVRLAGVHKGQAAEEFLPCPAPQQGGHCGSCRACWHTLAPVSYELH